ncbi:hypothetical protein [Wohlfahrtiimonas chitiniclastica]|uniref:hypothetical protein n=1 Tax=Wohlfahrtiimonas chitiniclastica TaxID=400946 RepID=UPI001BCCF013|nr:hypothetical protein [Wohlfahrtiimonas chitiniclastica]MBS7815930.1 hypothetical protein [Wohlfahrtiimonas chitiniclastica]MBS7822075.1 hypothetical protein [Wohlfahrtiimonas chitiniclastica]MBS7829867.1 hypothetical protein [Wohlfahrtiimonas chitiniclastica]MBS7831834.1 hypothetical protein [Wohlfahrtiimonas chitiniclastica]MBS7835145.1 hypothetical protein [Wohlfahrtiimonas chitiniclastica]
MKKVAIFFCVLIVIVSSFSFFVVKKMTIFTVQPIGAIPDGASILMWKKGDEPFFNSPDAICLKIQGSVSLLCRGMALTRYFEEDNVIYRMKYKEDFYLRSTNGKRYNSRWM